MGAASQQQKNQIQLEIDECRDVNRVEELLCPWPLACVAVRMLLVLSKADAYTCYGCNILVHTSLFYVVTVRS